MRQSVKQHSLMQPFNLDQYDRSPELTAAETGFLHWFVERVKGVGLRSPPLRELQAALSRLVGPVCDALEVLGVSPVSPLLSLLLVKMEQEGRSYWALTEQEWSTFMASDWKSVSTNPKVVYTGQFVALLYVLGLVRSGSFLNRFLPRPWDTARLVFEKPLLEAQLEQLRVTLVSQGYTSKGNDFVSRALGVALLVSRSPFLEDLSCELLDDLHEAATTKSHRKGIRRLAYGLFALNFIPRPVVVPLNQTYEEKPGTVDGIHPDWLAVCRRWRETSTLTRVTRRGNYRQLLVVGRWLANMHPTVTRPEQWTAAVARDFVVMVEQMWAGDWVSHKRRNSGKPLKASTKSGLIYIVRKFFQDCQEWGWARLSFNPRRCLQPSSTLLSQVVAAPRVIADDMWAKLLWAGLNLSEEDVCAVQSGDGYPIEMLRAVAITWLFGGLRMNEIRRLRVGCVRWQQALFEGTSETDPTGETVCLLSIPVNKTGSAFTKPIDPVMGRAIEAWEAVRPVAGTTLDRKTNERVDYLFNCRGRLLYRGYINQRLIPLLCYKAGIPLEDARGRITSHRARATIASQLYNARDGMNFHDLQAWLGHSSPEATQYYVSVSPARQAEAYAEAGYLEQNRRFINVLIDQEAVRNGDAQQGKPWRFYDVGHGHCTYDFFDQCPHRLACARCSFYVPKLSSHLQLQQARHNLEQMMQILVLNEHEQAAVADGVLVIEQLLDRLREIPTPDGRTPCEMQEAKPHASLVLVDAISVTREAKP